MKPEELATLLERFRETNGNARTEAAFRLGLFLAAEVVHATAINEVERAQRELRFALDKAKEWAATVEALALDAAENIARVPRRLVRVYSVDGSDELVEFEAEPEQPIPDRTVEAGPRLPRRMLVCLECYLRARHEAEAAFPGRSSRMLTPPSEVSRTLDPCEECCLRVVARFELDRGLLR